MRFPATSPTPFSDDSIGPWTAESMAAGVRSELGLEAADAFDEQAMAALLLLLRVDVVVTDELRSDVGGAEAMLVPVSNDAFSILVDPRPLGGWPHVSEADRVVLERRRLRFRTAHELGHVLFYSRSSGGAPHRRSMPSPAEEAFCDRFAAALLLPPSLLHDGLPSAELAYSLAARFDVSVHLVARSIAMYQPRVTSVSLIVHSDTGPQVQWTSDPSAARSAVEEIVGLRAVPADSVEWAYRGSQALRLERSLAAAR